MKYIFYLKGTFLSFLIGGFLLLIVSCNKNGDTVTTIHDTLIKKDTINSLADSVKLGMIAYFNFNGGSLNDSSGYGNNITFNNATTTSDRLGRVNNAYLFNGTNNYMIVKNSSSLTNISRQISLYAVVKINGFFQGACQGNDIIDNGKDYINGKYVLRYSPNPANGTNCSGGAVDTTTMIAYASFGDENTNQFVGFADNKNILHTNKWYTFTFTYDGYETRFYTDGKLVNIGIPTNTFSFTPNSNDINIGSNVADPLHPYWLNGVVDEIRIYNRALSDDEVAYLDYISKTPNVH